MHSIYYYAGRGSAPFCAHARAPQLLRQFSPPLERRISHDHESMTRCKSHTIGGDSVSSQLPSSSTPFRGNVVVLVHIKIHTPACRSFPVHQLTNMLSFPFAIQKALAPKPRVSSEGRRILADLEWKMKPANFQPRRLGVVSKIQQALGRLIHHAIIPTISLIDHSERFFFCVCHNLFRHHLKNKRII